MSIKKQQHSSIHTAIKIMMEQQYTKEGLEYEWEKLRQEYAQILHEVEMLKEAKLQVELLGILDDLEEEHYVF